VPRVVCVSDLHENLIDIPPCDLLVIAGDISYALKGDLEAKQRFLVGPFREWVNAVPAEQVAVVAGNHDQSVEQWGWPLDPSDCEYLQDSGARLCGLNVWGTPWQPWFYSWAFNAPQRYGEAFLEGRFSLIPDDTDVLICHGPPRGVGDGVGDPARPDLQEHVGSTALRAAIKRVQPKLMVCGHIHSGYGRWTVAHLGAVSVHDLAVPHQSTTIIVNAAVVDEAYKPVNAPWVIDL
jgi:Icc-related predicted phosphoesterase